MDGKDEQKQDVREELESVRKQLAEATTTLGNLHLRLTQLEERVSEESDISQSESSTGDMSAADQDIQSPEAALAIDIPTEVAEAPVTSKVERDVSTRSSGPDWEQLLGRNWFAIIGGIAVVLGIGFFLKLSFDNNWIGDTGRIVLGVVAGLTFMAVGEYGQRRVPRWAQAVTASAAAILYLSIYAAFGLYQLIPPELAFVLLAVVVTVAVLLALRYESIAIALLGVVGAFISPVLLGTDLPDERLVLAYILLVDVGILAISAFRNWRWLTLVGWLGSYGIFSYWLFDFPGFDPVFAHIALTGIFLSFAAATPLFHILWRRMPGIPDLTLMSINATGYFLLTTIILWDDYEGWFGLISLSISLLYGLIALAALKRSRTPPRIAIFSMAIASVFLALAFPLQFSGYSVGVGWAAQGVATVWLSFHLARWHTRALGVGVLALAVLHLILFDAWIDPEGYTPVLNGRFVTMAFVVVAFYAAGLIYWRYREAEGQFEFERLAVPSMLGMANLVTLGLLSLEVVNYLDDNSLRWNSVVDVGWHASELGNGALLALTLLWAIYGSAAAAVGFLRRYAPARWGGVVLLGVAVWKLLLYDTGAVYIDQSEFIPVLNIRFVSFVLVLALVSALAYWYRRNESILDENERLLVPGLLVAANAAALWMLSQEVVYYFDSLGARNGGNYIDAMHLTLTVLWAVYAMGVIAFGIPSANNRVRLAGMGLLAVPVAKLFVFDVFLLEMAYRVVAFITLGCLLLGMGLVYQRYSLVVRGFLFGSGADTGGQDG